MIKELFIILFVITCIGCESRNQIEIEFENHLPETDQVALQKIVDSYDNLIETVYIGNVDKFLAQIELNKPILKKLNKQKEYCELVELFEESTLEYKSENVRYDTVYLSNQGIITKRQAADLSVNELKFDIEIPVLPSGQTIEESMAETKKEGYWRFASKSSFTLALSKISNNNIEIQEYIDAKEGFGYINPKILASSIRKNEINLENYFIKRIVVLELFVRQIRKEYGC